MGLKQFIESVYSSVVNKKSITDTVAIEAGTQRTRLPGFEYLYESPSSLLSLYKQLYDNVPVLESAIDTYISLVNPEWTIESEDPQVAEFLAEELSKTNFNSQLNTFIESYFLYGFSAMEMVLSDNLDRVLKFITIPSTDLRVKRDLNANITDIYQTGLTARYFNINNRAVTANLTNAYRRDEFTTLPSMPVIMLNPNTVIYMARNPTLDNPYGRSLYLSLPFITRIMLQMQNAYGCIYEKYGSPRFHVKYIPAVQLNQKVLNERLDIIKSKFDNLEQQQDFFTAGDVEITTIGAGDGKTIHFATEMSEVMQAVFSGLKLPAGVLGYNYGSTETHLKQQIAILVSKIVSYQGDIQDVIIHKFMPLLAQVYNLSDIPKFKFGRPTIIDELAECQVEAAKITNAERKMSLQLIDVEDAQKELGLDVKTVEMPSYMQNQQNVDGDGNPIDNKNKNNKDNKDNKDNKNNTKGGSKNEDDKVNK